MELTECWQWDSRKPNAYLIWFEWQGFVSINSSPEIVVSIKNQERFLGHPDLQRENFLSQEIQGKGRYELLMEKGHKRGRNPAYLESNMAGCQGIVTSNHDTLEDKKGSYIHTLCPPVLKVAIEGAEEGLMGQSRMRKPANASPSSALVWELRRNCRINETSVYWNNHYY
mgnify:CR=1 FL=1